MTEAVGALATLTSLPWVHLFLQALRHRRDPLFLADLPEEPPPGGWPDVAVVLAARDEAAQIEPAVSSLLAQDLPGLRVVAVDDRSRDATGTILDAIARRDARLRVIHVAQLPPGWLGKTHALHVGSRAARAEWLLFTDGDVVLSPGALRRAVRRAVDAGAAHLTVIPDVPAEGAGEKLFLSLFTLMFMLRSPIWRAQDPRRRAHLGVGAFNLVRADALAAIGGFERIALSVDDDLRLGQALKYSGFGMVGLLGPGAVTVRWHTGLPALVRALEKNFYGSLDYRLWGAGAALAGILAVSAAPHLALLVGPWWARCAGAAGIAAVAAFFLLGGRRGRIGPHYALFLPLAGLLLSGALVRSVVQTHRLGGVRWRDHLYPLGALRAHVRERNRWLAAAWRERRPAR
jgi:cellulose synthase/poly-beta-1,6-N-acetylglucosamine synthase-like glycosyltransferase